VCAYLTLGTRKELLIGCGFWHVHVVKCDTVKALSLKFGGCLGSLYESKLGLVFSFS
jgi:hypothetical protein